MSNKEVLELWFERVWHQEEASVIHEMFVPEDQKDAAYGLQKEGGMKPDDYLAFHGALLSLIGNVRLEIINYLEQGEQLFAECTLTATKRGTKTPVSMNGCVIAKIADGKILSADNYFDFLNLFEALGALPPDTFGSCMAGGKVA